MNLRGKKYIVRISLAYDGWHNVTTAFASRHYGGGYVLDCGFGSVHGRDEAGAIKALRASRHAVNEVTAVSRRAS